MSEDGKNKSGGGPPSPGRRAPKHTIQTGAAKAKPPTPPKPPSQGGARLPPKPSAPGPRPGKGQVAPPKPAAAASPAKPPSPASGPASKPGAKGGLPPKAAPPGKASSGGKTGSPARPKPSAPKPPAGARPGASPPSPSRAGAKPAAARTPGAGRPSPPKPSAPKPAAPSGAAPSQGAAPASAPNSRPPGTEDDRPTLLVIGKLGPIESALRTALVQKRMHVEVASKDEAVMTAFAAAPDMVLLAGDAAQQEGSEVIELLAQNPATAVLPVILLADDPSLQGRLQAFRHGAVAVVPRSASVDEMARRITDLAAEVHNRPGHSKGELGEATLDELMDLLSKEVRSGILSVRAGDGTDEGAHARFVLRAGKPVQQAIEQFVHRLRPLVRQTEAPLSYTFEESTVARLDMLDGATEAEPASHDVLQGRRVLVVHDNPAQADVLAQELRARGATVVVSDGEGSALGRARDLDPDVVLVDSNGIDTWAYRIMTQLRQDVRLRWASVLLVDWREVWPEGAPTPDVDRLAAGMEPLIQPDQSLAERARGDGPFDTRLEILGPGRTLRALANIGRTVHLTVRHPRATVEVDLAEGLIAGAAWHPSRAPSKREEGPAALAALLSIGSGRVRVEPREVPSAANVMTPVPDALMTAAAEAPPLAPSIPPAAPEEDEPAGDGDLLADHSTDFDVDLEDEPTRVVDELVPAEPTDTPPSAPTPAGEGAAVPTELVHELRSLVQELRASREAPSGPTPAAAPTPPAAPPAPPAAPAVPPQPPPAAAASAPAQRAPHVEETLPVEAVEPKKGNLGKIVLGVSLVAGVALGIGLAWVLGEERGAEGGIAKGSAAPPAQVAAGDRGPGAEPPSAPPPAASAEASDEAEDGEEGEAADQGEEPQAEVADDEDLEEEATDDDEDLEEEATDDEDLEEEATDDDEDLEEETADDEDLEEEATDDEDLEEETAEDEDLEEETADGDKASKVKQRQQVVQRLVVRANSKRRARRFSQARMLYQRALKFHPRNPRALAGMVRTHMATGNPRAAVQYARRLVKARPGVAANYVLLGDTLKAAGDRAGARRAWRRALRIAPGYKPARHRLQQ